MILLTPIIVKHLWGIMRAGIEGQSFIAMESATYGKYNKRSEYEDRQVPSESLNLVSYPLGGWNCKIDAKQ